MHPTLPMFVIFYLASCAAPMEMHSGQNVDLTSGEEATDTQKENQSEASNEDATGEGVDEPVMVGGSFLTCYIDKKFGTSDTSVGVGCRFEKEGQKIEVEARPEIQTSSNKELEVYTLPSSDFWQWHVWLDVRDIDPESFATGFTVSFSEADQLEIGDKRTFEISNKTITAFVVDSSSGNAVKKGSFSTLLQEEFYDIVDPENNNPAIELADIDNLEQLTSEGDVIPEEQDDEKPLDADNVEEVANNEDSTSASDKVENNNAIDQRDTQVNTPIAQTVTNNGGT